MAIPELMLMLLIGIVFGGIAAVFIRGSRAVFIVNILLGIIGASIGAFFPVIMGTQMVVEAGSFDYLLRALLGAFLLVLVASLFRSAKPRSL